MTRPWSLDLDTLRLVLGYVEHDKALLLHMSLLNRVFHSLTLPILYRSNSFTKIEVAYKFCQALLDNPQSLGRFVQKLHLVHNAYGSARSIWSPIATKFLPLIQKTLALLPNLRDLHISGVEFEPNPDSRLPFSLQSFSLLLPMVTPPWELLRHQSSLKHLEFRSHSVHKHSKKSDCLSSNDIPQDILFPELNILSTCSGIFAALAPGRPITHARIRACQTHRDTVHMSRMLSAIQLSTKSIRILRIDLGSLHKTSCVEFIEHLKTISTIVSLEELTMITTALDNDYWQSPMLTDQDPSAYPPSPPELFSRLGALRHLVIEKPIWQPSIVFDQGLNVYRFQTRPMFTSVWSQVETVERWRTHCPRLVKVKIYGKQLKISPPGYRIV